MPPEEPSQPQGNSTNESPSVSQQPNPVIPSQPKMPTAIQPQPVQPSISSIYPEATHGITAVNQPIPSPIDNKKEHSKSVTFSEGYSVGGSIYWYQLIASIVFGIIMYGLTSSVLKTRSYSLAILVSLIAYIIQYLILIYIPYSVVRSEAAEEPIWLSLFGAAAQSVIIAAAFAIVDLLVVRTIINHSNSYAFPNVGLSEVAAIGVFVWVGLLIASYFLTKLAWGQAYALYSILSKMVVKAVGVIVIVIFIGGMVHHYLTAYNSHKSAVQTYNLRTNPAASLSRYTISGEPSYSVDFFRGSNFISVDGKQQLINSTPSIRYASLSFAKSAKSTKTCPLTSYQPFSFYFQGVQSLGCYTPDSSYGYFRAQGQNYVINVYSGAQQQQTIKSIFNSITIN